MAVCYPQRAQLAREARGGGLRGGGLRARRARPLARRGERAHTLPAMACAAARLSLRPTASAAPRAAARAAAPRRAAAAMSELSAQDKLKQQTAWKAVEYVKSGMKVGLGTGSTAAFAVARIGELMASGELTDITAVPTSIATYEQAKSLDIPLETLDTCPHLDVAIDGADEVDPDLNLVKGGGGALLREKMVEVCADKFIVIVDESKLCDGLGPGFPLPVEITPFCHMHTLRKIAALPSVAGCNAVLRMGTSQSNKVRRPEWRSRCFDGREGIRAHVSVGVVGGGERWVGRAGRFQRVGASVASNRSGPLQVWTM